MMMSTDTKERIMEAARLTVQDLGYSGLSFRELAKDVGIKSASIHYYFATKGELGSAITSRYTSHFAQYFEELLTQGQDLKTCMARYTDVFANTLRNGNRMCLAGILSAERNELPDDVRSEVVKWGEMNERWIARVLMLDARAKPDETARRARAIFAAVSGAQLIAHSRGDVSVFEEIISAYRVSGLLP
ncbi:TetR/AcrR family transcriptional regulator [Tardiphaga sp.]|jgi:TetR/AcrR family transcriptional repressor of nem operon|uniref:TetR/AcrR family transcriptional regulator n=1 Tax=Tardiphaga sp. TaxID=1926292 RepID=UPI003420F06E